MELLSCDTLQFPLLNAHELAASINNSLPAHKHMGSYMGSLKQMSTDPGQILLLVTGEGIPLARRLAIKASSDLSPS